MATIPDKVYVSPSNSDVEVVQLRARVAKLEGITGELRRQAGWYGPGEKTDHQFFCEHCRATRDIRDSVDAGTTYSNHWDAVCPVCRAQAALAAKGGE